MALSQNGWPANDRRLVARQPIPGTAVELTVRTDAAGLLLLEVAAAYDRHVEDIDNARGAIDDWGYAERPIRGSSTTSNHASGTAVDLNSTRRPLGVPAIETMSSEQIDRCHQIERATGGVVRWGGDWSRPDAMHWEIAPGQSLADCERALDAMRTTNGTAPQGLRMLSYAPARPLMRGDDVRQVQHALNAMYPWLNLRVDDVYGPKTADAVRYLQSRSGIAVDGVVGPQTRGVLNL